VHEVKRGERTKTATENVEASEQDETQHFSVRYSADSGWKADIAGGPSRANNRNSRYETLRPARLNNLVGCALENKTGGSKVFDRDSD
jgi:hypothetical protein